MQKVVLELLKMKIYAMNVHLFDITELCAIELIIHYHYLHRENFSGDICR